MEPGIIKEKKSFFIRVRNDLRKRFVAGILVIVPLWLTYFALKFFFRILDSFFAPIVKKAVGFSIPGFGFVLLIVFVYLIGLIVTNIVGRSLVRFGESILDRIPIVKNIYYASKQLVQTVSISRTMGFKRVTLIEYPRSKLLAIGFVTNYVKDPRLKKNFNVVFIPTTPNPTSGVFLMVPDEEMIETNMSIEEGLKMVISGGLVSPKEIVSQSKNTGMFNL